MAKVASSTCFTYRPDPNKSVEDNLQVMFEHIHNAVECGVPFSIKLELEAEPMDADEVNSLVKDAVAEATAMEKDAMIPVGVDKDQTLTYKRKSDIKE